MQDETFRTAFTFATLLRHRTSDAARRITAISLDTAAGRVFIGLASGHVEEHEIVVKHSYALDAGPSGTGLHATTRLVAEKRVSKQPVLSLACLPTASRLAILCEDGTAFVAAYDTWNVFALQGVRTAVAIAADPAPAAAAAAARWMPTDDSDTRNTDSGATATISGSKATGPAVPAAASIPPPRPVRLAVAVKSIATVAKLLVYSIAPSVGIAANQPPAHLLAQIPLQDAVQDLTWVGSGLFVQHATSYNLLQPGGRLLRIAEHGCCQPRMASAPWPGGRGGAADGAVASGRAVTTKPAAAAAAAAAARCALLFQDSLIFITDGSGAAVVGSEPISVSEPPLALCSSGNYFIAISDAEGVLVYDRTSSRLVQRIFWAHDDPWVTAAKRIPVAEDAGGGGGVAVATSGVVMLLQPVAPDLQARELLKRKRFDAALALIRSCRQAREGWADTALAQAGLLLLQELRCEDALCALEEVGPGTFQPAQLLPLFPRWCRRWLPAVPYRSYWGLHGSLQSLDRICDDFLELRNSTTSSPRPSPSPPASLRSSAGAGAATAAASQLLLPRGTSPDASVHGYRQPLPHPNHQHPHQHHPQYPPRNQHHHQHHHHHDQHQHHHHQHQQQQQQQQQSVVTGVAATGAVATTVVATGDGTLSPAVSAAGFGAGLSGGGGGGEGGGEVAALAADAKRHIVSYLLRNRGRPGVVCLEGIDTLLVHLLVDAGETAVLEAFLEARSGGGGEGGGVEGEAGVTGGGLGAAAVMAAARGPQACVSPRDTALVAALEGAGRFHALAVLRAGRGQIPQSLELWESLALGGIAESPSASGAVAAAAAAAAATVASAAVTASASSLASASSPPSDRALGSAATGGSGGADGAWAAAAARVAAAAAAALMALPFRTPPLLCLSKLPWLLQSAPGWALHVLRSRPLPVADVMSLLQGRYDGVRWQYMHHLVYGSAAAAAAAAAPSSSFRTELPPATASEDGQAGEEGFLGPPPQEAAAEEAVVGPAAAEAAPITWHLDPALHTELALELVECIGLLHSWPQQPQLQPPRREQQQQQEQHGEVTASTQQQQNDSNRAAAPPPQTSSAFSSASAVPEDLRSLPLEEEPPAELPPPLPPPLPAAGVMAAVPRHPSGGHDGVAAAAAAAAAHACSPPPLSTAAVGRRLSVVLQSGQAGALCAQGTATQAHPRSQQHHHVTSSRQVLAGADRGGGGGGGGGAAIVPYGSGGVAVCFASGGGGGGGGTGAAAAAATAASSVSTAELSWLGTLGLLPAAAVTRQLLLAIRAARLAAGLNPDLEQYLDLDAATAAGAGGGGAAPGGVDGISFPTAAAAAAAGGLGDSLSLLRALSRSGDGAGMGTLMGLRAVLQHHLYCSKLYDAAIVLQAIANGAAASATATTTATTTTTAAAGGGGGGGCLSDLLLRERVQLHCRQGDHPAALAVLALQLADVDGAICYCRSRCGQEGWLALLDLLLRPGGGREPDYGAACRVLAAEGAALAPLQVLEALNDDMPLHLAQGTLSRMVGSVQHRKRQGQILRALHRAQNLALRAEVAHLQASRVVLTDESLCPGCQRPLTTQVFYRYPSGVVLCARCARPEGRG